MYSNSHTLSQWSERDFFFFFFFVYSLSLTGAFCKVFCSCYSVLQQTDCLRSTVVALENENKTSIRKGDNDYALCQSVMQLIKGQGHLLSSLKD